MLERLRRGPTVLFNKCLNFGILTRKWGLVNALRIARPHNRDGLIRVQLRGLAHPIVLRETGVDRSVLEDVFGQGQYENAILEGVQPRLVVDAGAHIGLATVQFASRFPDAKIIAIEPNPENFALLRENAKPYPNVEPIQAAVWPREEALAIANPGDDSWAFRMSAAETGGTKAITLEQIVRRYGRIDLLKLDIEGAEKALFESGFENWLPKTRAICIELHDRIVPGCARAFYNALAEYDFERAQHHGEIDIVVIRERLSKEKSLRAQS